MKLFSKAKFFIVNYFLLLNSTFMLVKFYSVLFNKSPKESLWYLWVLCWSYQ